MDSNNGSPPPPPPPQGGDPSMEAGDWRSQLKSDSRQRIVNKIMDTLKRHLPFSSQDGLHELKQIAVRFEEKIYTAATSQSDYLRKISLKMLTMETKSQNTMANSVQTDSASNSYRPPEPGFIKNNIGSPSQGGDPSMEAGNWRSKLASDMRQQLINMIMATLNGHPPFTGPEGLDELKKTAARIEEEFYAAATSQSDYVHKISQKMLTFVNKPQKTMVNSLESNGAGNSNRLLNPGSSGMQPQVANQGQGQSVSMPLPANQSQTRQQFVPQNIQNNILPSGVQSSAGLSSALSPTVHYHLYYLQPPASGQNMSGLSSPQGLNMSGLSSALPLAGTMSGLSSARPPALFPTGALRAQQNMMNPSQPISSMVPGQGNAPKNLLQQVPVGSIQQTPVSAPQQANMNALSSQNGINMPQTNMSQQQRLQQLVRVQQIFQQRQQHLQRPGQLLTHQMPQLHQISVVNDVSKNASSSPSGSTMLQASIDSLKSNSGVVDNQHLKQEQEHKMFQNQLKQPYQQLQMQKPQILQDKQQQQQQQIQQLQQQAKQQLHHIYFIYLIFLTILLGAAFFGTGY